MVKDARPVGILMLDTAFPRPVGDIGNAASFDFPVLYRTVEAAVPDRVVRQSDRELLPAFIDAGQALIEDGAGSITTSCGFLVLFQKELEDALSVPVITSSLCQIAAVNAALPDGKKAGVLTISGSSLTAVHLEAAGAPSDTPVGSTEGGQEFTRAILNNETGLDLNLTRKDNVEAAKALIAAHPEVGALVLECTNMGPYIPEIKSETGLPVFSILDVVRDLHRVKNPR